MHVRKFEADTLEEALQDIKKQLGPDAIILKTVTNKGLKGAFKKSRIEITAAISEKNYVKKSRVDHVLTDDQKDKFYNNSSSYISNMINDHSENKKVSDNTANASSPASAYGKMGLNKQVNSVSNKAKDFTQKIKSGLDDFLSSTINEVEEQEEMTESFDDLDFDQDTFTDYRPKSEYAASPVYNEMAQPTSNVNSEEVEAQRKKIDDLEKKLYQLTKNFEKLERKEPTGIYQLRTTLKSLDISEHYIRDIIKRAAFELSEEDQESLDSVFEFALREMLGEVKCEMPVFSSVTKEEGPVVTIFVSESSCGQTSMVQKVGALKKDALIVRTVTNAEKKEATFAEKMFGMDVVVVDGMAEIASECRKAIESGRSVFVDYRNNNQELNEIKKFVDGMKRAFKNVEVLITLSAINSEIYNKKVVNRYAELANGLVVSNLDLCLNFGALFNLSIDLEKLPFKFFGTGDVVPTDIESATAERILAGIFQLN
ncbi:hypothetical protein M899_2980 [Bacteriovorax sp. BSW11_IV]|uniref:hypothetical protein n=1 Tax=Bacteriovorax sp. BSW11_IV TaxID=1353529 RepID=UPI00038A3C13|nr:hypothetical protein [Bacteriovorax sp. BSW11_IV]EQC48952.1 hypothetical protein M899_2980 [Bacteriovorax sp. BSW11_IV]